MKKVLIAFTLAVAAFPALAGIDDPAKPWSYFVHPVTCIGMPLQTARTGIQVTPEGDGLHRRARAGAVLRRRTQAARVPSAAIRGRHADR